MTNRFLGRRHLLSPPKFIAASTTIAVVLVVAAPARAQAIPGLDPVKVKTIPIHRDVSKSSPPGGIERVARTPSATNAATTTPSLSDIAPVKVQTMRVGPTGEMTRTDPAVDQPAR